MRIRLLKGVQRELIELAHKQSSWRELSKILGLSATYVRNDLRNEKRLLPGKAYKLLCRLVGKNFDDKIIARLSDTWGKSKGGKNSNGSTINLTVSDNKVALAEFIGIVLGDGNINLFRNGKKVGVYQVKIAGDYILDRLYHLQYIKPLCESLFNLRVREITRPSHGERFLYLSSKQLVEFFLRHGLKPGDKIKNKLTIPNWIFEDKLFLRACLRGLIDTDGCIHRMSRRDSNLLRIKFTNHNLRLLNDVRRAFVQLGFNVSKIISGRNIQISRKSDIEKYLREVGFSNEKHLKRLRNFRIAP